MKRKTRMFDKEYIESANKKIWQVLNDEKEYDDWTQICFSMKDAVQAAVDIYGCSSEIEIHKLFSFFREMVYKETENIQTFDITFKKKEGV
jgi:metal-dependent amidase/aminoacylase/carboxypeptidase family protein